MTTGRPAPAAGQTAIGALNEPVTRLRMVDFLTF